MAQAVENSHQQQDGWSAGRRATLSLEFNWIRAFRLSDGRLTRDRHLAEQDRQRRVAQRHRDVSAALNALLRVPVTIDNRRATPARVEFVRDLATAGVLPALVHGQIESLITITDATWQPLSRLRDLLHSEEVEHYCWTITLVDSSGQHLGVPNGYDPLTCNDAAPPVHYLQAALKELVQQGWQVSSVEATHDHDNGPQSVYSLDHLDWESLRALWYSLARSGAFNRQVH